MPPDYPDGTLFKVGDEVVERIGVGETALVRFTKVVSIQDGAAMTESQAGYDPFTGKGISALGYRAIHSIRYREKKRATPLKGGTK